MNASCKSYTTVRMCVFSIILNLVNFSLNLRSPDVALLQGFPANLTFFSLLRPGLIIESRQALRLLIHNISALVVPNFMHNPFGVGLCLNMRCHLT